MMLLIYGVVCVLVLVSFMSWRAMVCIVVPLALTSFLCQALMAWLGIGVKVATLPVIALGVGVGVDYGIYIYSRLAHFLRSGDLTPVYVPDEATEALRDLERARDAAKRAERTARHQLSKFLLRHGRRWDGGSAWTQKHLAWIRRQEFAQEAQQRVLQVRQP